MARGKKKEQTLTHEEKLQQALVPESEWPYKVPENWCWVRFGFLAKEMADGPFGSNLKTEHYTKNKEVRIIQLSNISEEGWKEDNIKYTTFEHAKEISRSIVEPGNIVIAKMMPAGRAIICPNNEKMYVLSSDAVKMVPIESINAKYLVLAINSPYFRNQVQENTQGITRARTSIKKLKEYPFVIPPLPEQQRIVDRIESMFAKLDEAKEKAQAVVDGFEDRKAAILHKAFTGELTERWRIAHNVHPHSWKEALWGEFLINIEAGKNWKAEGRPPINDEFGVVKVSAVTWGEFDELESKTCTDDSQWNQSTQINVGDFLFSRANTLQLVGNCVIVKNISKRLMLSDKILRFSFDGSVIPEYVLHYTRSRAYRDQIEDVASGNQDGMRNVSQKNLRLVKFPIPQLDEQRVIIETINKLIIADEKAKESAEQVIAQIDSMKKSILARAFRGELGTNDSSDESAEELLKRIL